MCRLDSQMQGTLFKWTNYISGKLRRHVLRPPPTVMLGGVPSVKRSSRALASLDRCIGNNTGSPGGSPTV